MINLRVPLLLLVLLVGVLAVAVRPSSEMASNVQTQSAASARENAYRENNIGVALLEQFKHKEGAEAFKRALQIDPKLALARINLAIALFNVPDLPGAQREAQTAIGLTTDAPQPHYILGLIAKSQSRTDDAIAAFQRVLKIDPHDPGTNINLGQLYAQQRKYTEAIAAFNVALEREPYNGTALYSLGQVLLRSQQRVEGQRVIQRFQELRERGSGTTLGQNYLEQGRYAEAVTSTGVEPGLVDKRTPDVKFADVTATALPAGSAWPFTDPLLEQFSGAALLFDYDGDGDLDLLEVASTSQRLYRNDAGKFTDVTAQAGDLAKAAAGVGTGAVAGDYDNDGKPDLFIPRYRASALYHNDGNGRFTDVTSKAQVPSYPYLSRSVAFVDYDHDGDLDLFIAGYADAAETLKTAAPAPKDATPHPSNPLFTKMPAAPGLLLRNNGDGTFLDQTDTAKLSGAVSALSVVPTDFDNRRDIDLLISSNGGVALWRNMRDGTFKDVAKDAGLLAGTYAPAANVASGDVNKDGFVDFYFAQNAWGGLLALSDGREHFLLKPAPGVDVDAAASIAQYNDASQFIDYDNDGLLDLVTAVTISAPLHTELRIWRNVGDGWVNVSDKATLGVTGKTGSVNHPLSGSRLMTTGDIDGDGDIDIIFGIPGGGLKVARNDGGNRNRSVDVQLVGKVSNRTGVGAKIDLRAGSLQQKLETYSASPAPAPASVVFGLGSREKADAVRIIWPSGVVQSETEFVKPTAPANFAKLTVTELDRKPSSCPFLYAWNGERFEFVTDFMGGGEMGYLEEPGRYNKPDPDEYVRLRSDQLREKNGKFELRVTNELEEALFVDRLQLLAIAHRENTEVYPNEGMTDPPKPFKLYFTRDARPPLSAVDDHGHDVLDRITALDRRYPDDFQLERIRGYAEEHSLTMNLGQTKSKVQSSKSKVRDAKLDKERTVLLMTGWTDYAWSSDNVAASQAGQAMKLPALKVKDAEGKWRTVIADIGIPVGRPQTVVVDLTGKFLSASREVRIVTSMRIYWDQVLVDTSNGRPEQVITRLEPATSTLRWRGFSREASADGREPFGYNYNQVSYLSPWKVMTGRYTREGDVLELLLKSDDMFVISMPGDEISISFDASALTPLASGWKRTFLLYADGYSKEMDINSASPDQVGPLPFHRMTKYPYTWPEKYPLKRARQEYLDRYNTRVVKSPVPAIDTALIPLMRNLPTLVPISSSSDLK
ncbi:MAG: FG-GAP-like repeat-containing protein [Pyrinomonadaceae bacterium]|nr:FG-GAP-like repeat-containing protein [Pyrinomonadaceae bacterium]